MFFPVVFPPKRDDARDRLSVPIHELSMIFERGRFRLDGIREKKALFAEKNGSPRTTFAVR